MNLSLPVESVRERDIDFLLVEEFLSSKDFATFFTKTLGLPPSTEITKVERSINDFGIGETDVLVEYISDNLKIVLLIENKLDALFQPRQAERYHERAVEYTRQKTYDEAFAILVAPAQYIDRQNDFSFCISYEQIAEYFKNSTLEARGDFKAQLLKIASEKLRRGYVAVNSEPNQAFWYSYREALLNTVPSISMKPVSVVPANSDWIDLSYGTQKFIHKLAKGYLDFTNPSAEFEEKIIKTFGESAERLEFNSGKIIRIHTTPLVRLNPFHEQLEQYEQCVRDAVKATSLL